MKDVAKKLVKHIGRNMERESPFAYPEPQWFMNSPETLLDLIVQEFDITPQEVNDWLEGRDDAQLLRDSE